MGACREMVVRHERSIRANPDCVSPTAACKLSCLWAAFVFRRLWARQGLFT